MQLNPKSRIRIPNPESRWIGMVAAFRWEVRPLLRRDVAVKRLRSDLYSLCLAGKPVLLAISGMGIENSFRAAQALLRDFPLRGLVTVGFAGALSETLDIGDIVVADSVVEESTQERFDCRQDLLPVKFVGQGSLLCVPEVVSAAGDKKRLNQKWGAVAVDMESAGVARAAASAGLAFCAIKSITDSSQQTISIDFRRCRSEHGILTSGRILREGIRTRQAASDLWRLAQGARRAAGSLATALYAL